MGTPSDREKYSTGIWEESTGMWNETQAKQQWLAGEIGKQKLIRDGRLLAT